MLVSLAYRLGYLAGKVWQVLTRKASSPRVDNWLGNILVTLLCANLFIWMESWNMQTVTDRENHARQQTLKEIRRHQLEQSR